MQVTLPPEYVEWFRIRKIDVREFVSNFMKWYTWEVQTPRHKYHEQLWVNYKRELQSIEFTKEEEVILGKLIKKLRLQGIVTHEYNWCKTAYLYDKLELNMKTIVEGARKVNYRYDHFVALYGEQIKEVQLFDENFEPFEFLKHAKYSHEFSQEKGNQRLMEIQTEFGDTEWRDKMDKLKVRGIKRIRESKLRDYNESKSKGR